jgi:hypothetical protein
MPLDDDFDDPADDSWEEETTDTVTCPACGADVYEDADQCPSCREFILPDTCIWSGQPVWWVALGVLGIIALAAALILGF